MPIEIKELNIKINVEEHTKHVSSHTISPVKLDKMKAEIIRSCTRNVLDIIKEKQER